MAIRAKKRTSRRPAASLDAARLADLKVATKAIGATPAERLAWVVRFVREDPASGHSAMRAAHGDCLVALGRGGFPDSVVEVPNLPPALAPEKVTALHAELRAMLRAAVSKVGTQSEPIPMVQIPTKGLTEHLVRASGVGVRPAQWGMSYGYTRASVAIFQAVKGLILSAGERLIACPACAMPFFYVRKQRFCQTKCAQRIRNERKAVRQKGGAR